MLREKVSSYISKLVCIPTVKAKKIMQNKNRILRKISNSLKVAFVKTVLCHQI